MSTYSKPFHSEHSEPICPSSYTCTLSSLSSSYCENRQEASMTGYKRAKRRGDLVSISFLDSLGVSHALPGGVATAKGIILLLESTHHPTLLVNFGLPNLRQGWENVSLAPSPTPSRSTCWTSLRSAIFTPCIVPCVIISAWCPPTLRTQSSHSEMHTLLNTSLSC